MSGLPASNDPRVLVGHHTGDDAGVYQLDKGRALVQTVDFFTPVVDDPTAFGAIAAANALSDVYAMGGQPITALAIAAFPEKDFPLEWARAIFQGGHSKLLEAGCVLLGGHTVRDPEVKFGYAVTGLVDPERMLTHAGGRSGDVLVLTKPLGTGVIATALKAGAAPADAVDAATRAMSTLNRIPSAVAVRHGVRAATDITGFGLVGHALGLALKVSLELVAEALPLLPHARELAPGSQAAGLKSNRQEYEKEVEYRGSVDEAIKLLLFDPQTSGGLLLLVPGETATALLAELPNARVVGRATPRGRAPIVVV